MTDQRPFSSSRAQGRTAAQPSRKLLTAAATAAIPAVVLSSAAFALPAQAAEQAPRMALQPKLAGAGLPVQASRIVPAADVALLLPSTLRPALKPTPSAHTVKSGETISGIAARYGLGTSKVLSLNGLKPSSIIYPGQKIKLSGSASSGSATKSSSGSSSSSGGSYTVKSGDTLSGIAARHGMGLSKILSLNGLKASSIIYPGQKIKVSGSAASSTTTANTSSAKTSSSSGGSYTVKSGDTLSGIAARHDMGLSKILSLNGLKATSTIYPGQKIKVSGSAGTVKTAKVSSTTASSSGSSYTVKAGDTLYGIAIKHNITLSKLLQSSGLKSTSVIYPGQKIKVSGAGSSESDVNAASAEPLVPSTFLHYSYPKAVVAKANENKRLLLSTPQPSQSQMKAIIADTARSMGVDPALALAHAYQESGFQQTAVSPANAIGAMQVIPASGDWASDLVGRKLNLLDPYDNATAGVAIISALVRTSDDLDDAIASYYQGQHSVKTHGMFDDTKTYVKAIKAHMKNF
ncbi:LysM peptidoglycan-binding domain-containing protein [Arthrobacter crystallopoietes]|uniref:Soluble lytic murein transglycosylase n=1 Tax=Crystallibacter crystallopoietes TaxID=37928 RepID=A0A1H1GYN3_9MICC|nr:LysM peptidoglycan-binding domain-containing protein [Arthrobacter crystallopoietes]AUI52271.1 lytic transglycosylase [Arthrobacter crystallopoietes]SDR18270.1 Soluble lytic murein transglycosylase [Arthrobacter crystallopoietes]